LTKLFTLSALHTALYLVAACFVFPAAVVAFQQLPSTRGQELFTSHCALCHGATGEGSSGPDLTNPLWQARISDPDLERTLREGFGAPPCRPSVIVFIRVTCRRSLGTCDHL
jgi:cytochrome c5